MRPILGLCLLMLAIPVFAGDPENPDSARSTQSWIGKHSSELIASLGEPRKTRRHGEGGRVLVFRHVFYGSDVVGLEQRDDRSDPACSVGFEGGLSVVATQKAKFYVDGRGVIQREEIAPIRWKRAKP